MEPTVNIHERISKLYTPINTLKHDKDCQTEYEPITSETTSQALVVRNQNVQIIEPPIRVEHHYWHLRGFKTFLLLIIMIPYYKLLSSSYANTFVDYLQVTISITTRL